MSVFAGREPFAFDGEAARLLESIQDACFSLDPEWRFTYANQAAESFFRRPRMDLLGQGLLDLFPQLIGTPGHARIARAYADRERARFETVSAINGTPIELDIHPDPAGGVSVFVRDVGARWRLEEQLRERDEQLRLAEHSAGIGVWDIDVASDTVRGTSQFFRIMGLPPSDEPVPMQTLRSLRVGADRELVNRGYQDAVERGTDFYESKYRIRRPDGGLRLIFGRGRIIRDGKGVPVRYSGVDIDITEREQAEHALAESEDRLRLAIEAVDLGIWDWNTLTNEMTFNDRAKRIFGFPPDAPVTFAQVREATHPEDLPRTSQLARRALDPAVRSEEAYDYRIVRPDGAVRWVLAHGGARFAEVDGEQKAYRYIGTIQDVTARKEADTRLNRSEARLRLAVEAARLAVWSYDLASARLENTAELNRLLGFPEDQPLDVEEIRRRYLPDEQPRVEAAATEALARGERYFQIECRYAGSDGETRWFLLRAEILLGDGGKPSGALGVLMDITERKTAEEHRELIVAELKHRVKNTLSLAAAMAGQTFRGDDHRAALDTFLARLTSLGQAHDLLFHENWQSADCREIIEKSLLPHRTGTGRFRLSGPPVRLASRQALSLALALNELATNAAKYGALSASGGHVDLVWSIVPGDAPDAFTFRWIESGGPPVSPPSRTGFGTRLVQRSLAAEFNGEVLLEYPPAGFLCTLKAPDPSRALQV